MDVDDDGDGVLTEMEVGFGCAAGQEASIVKLTVKGTTAAWLQCLDPEGAEVTYQRLAIGGAPGPDEVAYRDTDGDGIYDFQDPDDDGDGIATADELGGDATPADRDGDGTPDYLDEFDEDGPLGDLDADGIPNEVEEELQLDPFDNDSDGDGVHDGDEIGDDWTEPMDSDGDGTPDVFDTDDDNDGVDTADESRGDTDGDGIPDYLDTDSDDDGVDDGEEYGVDDDCDGDPDHIDAILNEGLCDQVAFDPGYYERQACSCASGTTSGWLGGWLALGLGWMVRRR
jgi:heat shock protein beta